jgi:predicted GIY-YIG superfamily endonuclease
MPRYWSDMCDLQTCVYRFYDVDNHLLYVGISMNFEGRLAKHRRRPWWPSVARQTFEWYPNRTSAKDAERWAIHHENPLHNLTRPRMECC